jgi:hypothetical protein
MAGRWAGIGILVLILVAIAWVLGAPPGNYQWQDLTSPEDDAPSPASVADGEGSASPVFEDGASRQADEAGEARAREAAEGFVVRGQLVFPPGATQPANVCVRGAVDQRTAAGARSG